MYRLHTSICLRPQCITRFTTRHGSGHTIAHDRTTNRCTKEKKNFCQVLRVFECGKKFKGSLPNNGACEEKVPLDARRSHVPDPLQNKEEVNALQVLPDPSLA